MGIVRRKSIFWSFPDFDFLEHWLLNMTTNYIDPLSCDRECLLSRGEISNHVRRNVFHSPAAHGGQSLPIGWTYWPKYIYYDHYTRGVKMAPLQMSSIACEEISYVTGNVYYMKYPLSREEIFNMSQEMSSITWGEIPCHVTGNSFHSTRVKALCGIKCLLLHEKKSLIISYDRIYLLYHESKPLIVWQTITITMTPEFAQPRQSQVKFGSNMKVVRWQTNLAAIWRSSDGILNSIYAQKCLDICQQDRL